MSDHNINDDGANTSKEAQDTEPRRAYDVKINESDSAGRREENEARPTTEVEDERRPDLNISEDRANTNAESREVDPSAQDDVKINECEAAGEKEDEEVRPAIEVEGEREPNHSMNDERANLNAETQAVEPPAEDIANLVTREETPNCKVEEFMAEDIIPQRGDIEQDENDDDDDDAHEVIVNKTKKKGKWVPKQPRS